MKQGLSSEILSIKDQRIIWKTQAKELNLKRQRETIIDDKSGLLFLWNANTGTLEVTS